MKNFKSYYTIPAPPEDVYLALTNPLTIQLWTGEKAVMSTEEGSEFSLWEDSIVGRNLAFEPNKKIVQHWYFEGEPAESIVTILLHPHEKGTSVELLHTNIPDAEFEEFIDGWNNSYFGKLRVFYQ